MSRQMDSVGDRLAVGTGEVCVAVVFAKVGDEVGSTAIEDGLASRALLDLDMAAHSACDFGGGKADKLALAKYRQVLQ
ncbi:O-fucosyltransferase family protein, partial [Fagus crenata]